LSGIDFTVWLGLLLSLASGILCVAYGLARWNADDDDPVDALSSGATVQNGSSVDRSERDGR
jgi:hypothetical protein